MNLGHTSFLARVISINNGSVKVLDKKPGDVYFGKQGSKPDVSEFEKPVETTQATYSLSSDHESATGFSIHGYVPLSSDNYEWQFSPISQENILGAIQSSRVLQGMENISKHGVAQGLDILKAGDYVKLICHADYNYPADDPDDLEYEGILKEPPSAANQGIFEFINGYKIGCDKVKEFTILHFHSNETGTENGGNWIWLYDLLKNNFIPDLTLEEYNRKWAWLEDVISYVGLSLLVTPLVYLATGDAHAALQASYFIGILMSINGHKKWIANLFGSRAPPQYLESAKKIAGINLLLGVIQLVVPVPFWISFPLLLTGSFLSHYLYNIYNAKLKAQVPEFNLVGDMQQVAKALGASPEERKLLVSGVLLSFPDILDSTFGFWTEELDLLKVYVIDFSAARNPSEQLLLLRALQRIEEHNSKNPSQKVQYLIVNKNNQSVESVKKLLGISGELSIWRSSEDAAKEVARLYKKEPFSLRILTTQRSSKAWALLLSDIFMAGKAKVMEILDVGEDFSLSLWESGEGNSNMKEWAEKLEWGGNAELEGNKITIRGVPLELPSPDEERKLKQLFHQHA